MAALPAALSLNRRTPRTLILMPFAVNVSRSPAGKGQFSAVPLKP